MINRFHKSSRKSTSFEKWNSNLSSLTKLTLMTFISNFWFVWTNCLFIDVASLFEFKITQKTRNALFISCIIFNILIFRFKLIAVISTLRTSLSTNFVNKSRIKKTCKFEIIDCWYDWNCWNDWKIYLENDWETLIWKNWEN